MSLLVDHWRRLTGPVHPDDAPVFANTDHSFHLDFPPPAYVGDVDRAPVILLMAHGGYDPALMAVEFPDQASIQRYLDRLHDPRPVQPGDVSPYYAAANYAPLIASGRLALVNAVAYRSRKFKDAPENRALAEHLPSTFLHRRWLRQNLIPSALVGDRMVVVHQWRLWGLKKEEIIHPNILWSAAPVAPNLARADLARAETFDQRTG
ncbi:hypothetical protein LHP98_00155 [Rhodobacter sp. Har01]|uniref:hypothetical protein n=1 Tax=Rhodobacter sp. Har01 TaxID=2883999 RepID=UPI001D091A50|nr:hypothetical protein [Rhodobacter sp. Har01]MCB6176540.1 hypothetical protein [Rhodobacter sp. Har01]